MRKETKYKVGQVVLIDRIFSTENELQGKIEKLPRIREAIVLEVEPTPSFGPSYKIEWVDKSFPKPRIRYWESDILGPANKIHATKKK